MLNKGHNSGRPNHKAMCDLVGPQKSRHRTYDKYAIDRFLSSFSEASPFQMTLGKFIARHIYSVISLCPSLCLQDIISISHEHEHRFLSQRHPHNFFSHQIYHSSRGRWAWLLAKTPHFWRPGRKNLAWFVIKCVWHLPESNHPSFFSRIYQTKLCFQFSGGLYYFLSHGWLALYFSFFCPVY